MNRTRTTEDPGVWRLVHDVEPKRRITLEVFEGPGMRARTIRIVADGGVYIDGRVIMSALTPRRRAAKSLPRDVIAEEIHAIALEVQDASGVTVEEMRGRSKRGRDVEARKVAMFLAVHRLEIAQSEIARYFGRDRSVVSAHAAEVEALCRDAAPAAPENYGRGEVSESKTF